MSDRLPGSCWHNPIRHGKWRIYVSESPLPGENYAFVHDDYDGADVDHETSSRDRRCGYAATVDAAKQAIDEYEEDHR